MLPNVWAVLKRAARPPVHEARFWVVQLLVLLVAGIHLLLDANPFLEGPNFPVGIPVALLIVPTGYAALRYGLSGSAATAAWASLLWSPDLLLPHSEGHTGSDLVNLALVDAVAIFVGWKIESEHLMHARAMQANLRQLEAEARYRRLFEANRSPIAVLSGAERHEVTDANPAALAAFGRPLLGRPLADVLGENVTPRTLDGKLVRLPDGHDYRARIVGLQGEQSSPATQVIFEDVTEERREGIRATKYAQLVLSAEEDQRRKLSRELHDEPLQLFLHLARNLDALRLAPDVPPAAARELAQARDQALQAAVQLRSLARSLRPPALDQLGLVPAVSSLLSEVEEGCDLDIGFEAKGKERRLPPELELGAFRIVQEAVRNAMRHAQARHLDVAIDFSESSLYLGVRDDGCGFDPDGDEAQASEHLGLLGMRERSRLLGGSLSISSASGVGTSVSATIPLPAA